MYHALAAVLTSLCRHRYADVCTGARQRTAGDGDGSGSSGSAAPPLVGVLAGAWSLLCRLLLVQGDLVAKMGPTVAVPLPRSAVALVVSLTDFVSPFRSDVGGALVTHLHPSVAEDRTSLVQAVCLAGMRAVCVCTAQASGDVVAPLCRLLDLSRLLQTWSEARSSAAVADVACFADLFGTYALLWEPDLSLCPDRWVAPCLSSALPLASWHRMLRFTVDAFTAVEQRCDNSGGGGVGNADDVGESAAASDGGPAGPATADAVVIAAAPSLAAVTCHVHGVVSLWLLAMLWKTLHGRVADVVVLECLKRIRWFVDAGARFDDATDGEDVVSCLLTATRPVYHPPTVDAPGVPARVAVVLMETMARYSLRPPVLMAALDVSLVQPDIRFRCAVLSNVFRCAFELPPVSPLVPHARARGCVSPLAFLLRLKAPSGARALDACRVCADALHAMLTKVASCDRQRGTAGDDSASLQGGLGLLCCVLRCAVVDLGDLVHAGQGAVLSESGRVAVALLQLLCTVVHCSTLVVDAVVASCRGVNDGEGAGAGDCVCAPLFDGGVDVLMTWLGECYAMGNGKLKRLLTNFGSAVQALAKEVRCPPVVVAARCFSVVGRCIP